MVEACAKASTHTQTPPAGNCQDCSCYHTCFNSHGDTPCTTVSENLRFLISDVQNAIGNFESLDVAIDHIVILMREESRLWVNLTPQIPKVDFKQL